MKLLLLLIKRFLKWQEMNVYITLSLCKKLANIFYLSLYLTLNIFIVNLRKYNEGFVCKMFNSSHIFIFLGSGVLISKTTSITVFSVCRESLPNTEPDLNDLTFSTKTK